MVTNVQQHFTQQLQAQQTNRMTIQTNATELLQANFTDIRNKTVQLDNPDTTDTQQGMAQILSQAMQDPRVAIFNNGLQDNIVTKGAHLATAVQQCSTLLNSAVDPAAAIQGESSTTAPKTRSLTTMARATESMSLPTPTPQGPRVQTETIDDEDDADDIMGDATATEAHVAKPKPHAVAAKQMPNGNRSVQPSIAKKSGK